MDAEKRFTSFAIHKCRAEQLNDLEAAYIKKYKPMYNIAQNPREVKAEKKYMLREDGSKVLRTRYRKPRDENQKRKSWNGFKRRTIREIFKYC